MIKHIGKVWKLKNNFWLAEVPELDAMTQGYTRKEALEMAVDLIKCHVGSTATVTPINHGEFEFTCEDNDKLEAAILKRTGNK